MLRHTSWKTLLNSISLQSAPTAHQGSAPSGIQVVFLSFLQILLSPAVLTSPMMQNTTVLVSVHIYWIFLLCKAVTLAKVGWNRNNNFIFKLRLWRCRCTLSLFSLLFAQNTVYILFIQLNLVLKLCAETADCMQNVIDFMWCYVPLCDCTVWMIVEVWLC